MSNTHGRSLRDWGNYNIPRYKEFWYVVAEGISHVFWANVSNALQSQADVNWVTAGKVVLDWLDHQLHQLTVRTDKDRDE